MQVDIWWNGFGTINSGETRIHPTQKPVQLYSWILQNYAQCEECGGSGEVASTTIDCDVQTCKKCKGNSFKILDTHLGSGSIALAIDKANRLDNMNLKFVGIELDEEYYSKSVERIIKSTRQQYLPFE